MSRSAENLVFLRVISRSSVMRLSRRYPWEPSGYRCCPLYSPMTLALRPDDSRRARLNRSLDIVWQKVCVSIHTVVNRTYVNPARAGEAIMAVSPNG
jgi:hypothetical protein